jgi:hypothetical protein
MKAPGDHIPAFADLAATKLFTVGHGHETAALALPPMNNFG